MNYPDDVASMPYTPFDDEREGDISWAEGSIPSESGWYAVRYCWDVTEGGFCSSNYFDGISWCDNLPITHYAGSFELKAQADGFCEINDMSY